MGNRFDIIYGIIEQLTLELAELEKEVIFIEKIPTIGNTLGVSIPTGIGSSLSDSTGNTTGTVWLISTGKSIFNGTGTVVNSSNSSGGGAWQVAPITPPATEDILPIVLVDIGVRGVTKNYWSQHLGLRWKKNTMGDWRDLNDTPQGNIPFAQFIINAMGEITLDVTSIIKSRKPILLACTGKSSPSVLFYGRLSEYPPKLIITNSLGEENQATITGFATWNSSSDSDVDSSLSANISTIGKGGISYTYNSVDIASAKLVLNVKSFKYVPTISLYKCDIDPPLVAGGGKIPVQGIAKEAGNEEALKTHPAVFLACDFSDPENSFSGYGYGNATVPELLDDPEYPGRKILRGKFVPGGHGSMNFSIQLSKPDLTDPRRPILYAPEQFYQRMYVTLEDDFLDVWQDGQKSGIGIDQRFGWWTDSGYWQNTTGNGGIVGSGRRFLRPAKTFPGQTREQWEYQGHSQRMEFGMAPSDPRHPYYAYRPIQMYTYHIDQRATGTGDTFTFGNACLPVGKKVCIETFVKTNTVVGPYDADGNGEALYDGIMALWIDGVFIGSIDNFRWRRHPHMGVEGPWGVWYYGGRGFPPHDMHYQMSDFVCAKEYIGPRVI